MLYVCFYIFLCTMHSCKKESNDMIDTIVVENKCVLLFHMCNIPLMTCKKKKSSHGCLDVERGIFGKGS